MAPIPEKIRFGIFVATTPYPTTKGDSSQKQAKYMSLLKKLFGNFGSQKGNMPEHAVIIHFKYELENLAPLHELESKLEKVLSGKHVGDYDGHEIATDYSDGFLYLYGPNAENLFKEIKATLESTDFMKGAVAKLRFGPPEVGIKQIEVRIG